MQQKPAHRAGFCFVIWYNKGTSLMSRKYLIGILAIALLAIGAFYFLSPSKPVPDVSPDGGGGGILPFDSGVHGQVLLGPVCPVERIPPDPACADKPYQTIVQVIRLGSAKSSPFAVMETDKEGRFSITLPPGEYALVPAGGKVMPRCASQTVTVKPGVMQEVNLSCDSGIR